jgi:hypothetical protein
MGEFGADGSLDEDRNEVSHRAGLESAVLAPDGVDDQLLVEFRELAGDPFNELAELDLLILYASSGVQNQLAHVSMLALASGTASSGSPGDVPDWCAITTHVPSARQTIESEVIGVLRVIND